MEKTGADPRKPIGAAAALPGIKEQMFPYPKETPGASPAPTGSNDCHFGAAGAVGPRGLGLGCKSSKPSSHYSAINCYFLSQVFKNKDKDQTISSNDIQKQNKCGTYFSL